MNADLYALVLAGGLLLVVFGYLMVFFAALRKGLLLGIVGLIPVVNLFIVTRNWSRSLTRNGFLVSVVGLLLAGVGYYGGGDAPLLAALEPQLEERGVTVPKVEVPLKITRPQDVEVPNQAEAEAAGVDLETSVLDQPEIEPGFVPEPLPPAAETKAPPPAVAVGYAPICAELLPEVVGKPVRITLKDGATKEGRLSRYEFETLYLAQRMTGGELELSYALNNLSEVQVYDRLGAGRERARRCIELRRRPPAPAAAPPAEGEGAPTAPAEAAPAR